jgi:hypothetical protein
MGVFDAIPQDGMPITATELAGKLGVDKELLGEWHCLQQQLAICRRANESFAPSSFHEECHDHRTIRRSRL